MNQITLSSPSIFIIRSLRVMLDSDLAKLYEVSTSALNRAVSRNQNRFPSDFMFQITKHEFENLVCQIGIPSSGYGGRRSLPFVFTEQGVAMLSGVLKSEKAAMANVEIMRAFVRLREMTLSNRSLALRLSDLEKKYDSQFASVFDAIRKLMLQPAVKTRKIGIHDAD